MPALGFSGPMLPKKLALLALVLVLPVAAAAAWLAPDATPRADHSAPAPATLRVRIESVDGPADLHVRVLDARGALWDERSVHVAAHGASDLAFRVPLAPMRAEVRYESGVWPFATRIVSSGAADPAACASHAVAARFQAEMSDRRRGIAGPWVACA